MLSRVADSLYWLGRYAERIETNAHIIYTQMDHMLEQSREDSSYKKEWDCVLRICGHIEDYKERYEGYYLKQMNYYLLFDENNFDSISYLIKSIRNNARNARDIIPNELWEEWNEFYLAMQNGAFPIEFSVPNTAIFLGRLRKTALSATGIIDSLMTRDECFQFLKIGKWIERSEKTAIIAHELLENQNKDSLNREFAINFGLQLTNTLEEYNRRFRSRKPDEVLNFIVGDIKCTRSIAYGLRKIKKTVLDIEESKIRLYANEMFQALEELEQLVQIDSTSLTIEERREWIDTIGDKLTSFGPIFSKTYYLTAPILVD